MFNLALKWCFEIAKTFSYCLISFSVFFFFCRAFMVDKDFAEINALQKVFPESAILLCWYHVLQVNHIVFFSRCLRCT